MGKPVQAGNSPDLATLRFSYGVAEKQGWFCLFVRPLGQITHPFVPFS